MTDEASPTYLDNLPDFDPEEAPEDRKLYFEALDSLRQGETKEALKLFRRGARKCAEPFDVLSAMGAGECQRLLGQEGAALRTWGAIAGDDDQPHALRYTALLNMAALEEARGNQRAFETVQKALLELGEPEI